MQFLENGSNFGVDDLVVRIDGSLSTEDQFQNFAHGHGVEVQAEDVIGDAGETGTVTSRSKNGLKQLGALGKD